MDQTKYHLQGALQGALQGVGGARSVQLTDTFLIATRKEAYPLEPADPDPC